jgi:hypothetical protein
MVFKKLVTDSLKHFVSVLGEIATDKNINAILTKLIKQPDNVAKHLEYGYDYDDKGNKRVISEITKENSKQGSYGLLDIIDKAFSVIGLINNLKLPNFFKFYKLNKQLKKQLIGIIDSLVSVFDELNTAHNGQLFDKMNLLARIIVGDGEDSQGNKQGESIGMFQVIQKLKIIINQILSINLTNKNSKQITNLFVKFKNVINSLVVSINDPQFIELGSDKINKRIDDAKRTINSFVSIAASIQDSIRGILFLVHLKKPIIKSIDAVAALVYSINRRFNNVEIGNTAILDEIDIILNNLINISKKLIIVGLLSIPAR